VQSMDKRNFMYLGEISRKDGDLLFQAGNKYRIFVTLRVSSRVNHAMRWHTQYFCARTDIIISVRREREREREREEGKKEKRQTHRVLESTVFGYSRVSRREMTR